MELLTRSQSLPLAIYNTKILALESSLQDIITKFKELVLDLEQLHIESENYKLQYLSVKNKCENKTCCGAEELKKVIATKDQIIQSVAANLTKLKETKNFDILTDAFKVLFQEVSPLTPPVDDKLNSSTSSSSKTSPIYKNKEEPSTSITEDVSFNEESLCEIEGTPTGRTSPIIHTKRIKSNLARNHDSRDKKKCPEEWTTPESKTIKLTFPTPSLSKTGNRRMRQARLNIVKLKQTNVIDLTCSPELLQRRENLVHPLIKKESMEDDTILPSPTSGPTNFSLSSLKASPIKFKKPPLSLKIKNESTLKHKNKIKSEHTTNIDMEESINILNQYPNRLRNVTKENETPLKANENVLDEDATHCDTNASISLLQHLDQIELEHTKKLCSPAKCPLAENINVANTPPKNDLESSMSILRPETNTKPALTDATENVKRKIPKLVEPLYKEAAVRTKMEKRNLQGWSCEECKNFYGELYKNDPVMLERKINECSKHRGRHNPIRPKTPPNFWNPRWHVPTDTEELNKMNNAE